MDVSAHHMIEDEYYEWKWQSINELGNSVVKACNEFNYTIDDSMRYLVGFAFGDGVFMALTSKRFTHVLLIFVIKLIFYFSRKSRLLRH